MHTIWLLIIGTIVGAIASMIVGDSGAGGCLKNSIAGLVGSFVGERLFGDWGFHLAGIAIIPAILGAVIVIIILQFIMNRLD